MEPISLHLAEGPAHGYDLNDRFEEEQAGVARFLQAVRKTVRSRARRR